MEEGNRKIAEWLNDHEHKEFSVYISGHEPYNFRDPRELGDVGWSHGAGCV